MKFNSIILALFFTSFAVTWGEAFPKATHELTRSQFKTLFLDKDVLGVAGKISESSIRVYRLAAYIIELDKLIQPIRLDGSRNFQFLDKSGKIIGPGITADNLSEPSEKDRYIKEKDEFEKNLETLNSYLDLRREILSRIVLIGYNSTGDMKKEILNLAEALRKSSM